MLLAPKADRFARALLVQDSDPQVLFALLKNPRLALDEVLRVAKSSFLSFQAAELILKTNPWFANLDVRVALIRNPKLPTPFALHPAHSARQRSARHRQRGRHQHAPEAGRPEAPRRLLSPELLPYRCPPESVIVLPNIDGHRTHSLPWSAP